MCHVSVGHVARAFEAAGVPTTAIYVSAFRHVAEEMALPRVLITRHPFGRPVGAAGDFDRQREVVSAALELVTVASEGRWIRDMPGVFTGTSRDSVG